jgi:phospholipid-binding lipoprotein MlaA
MKAFCARYTGMVLAGFLLAGCGTVDEAYDPLETVNRGIYRFNMAVDKAVVRPVAVVYRDVLPKPVQTGVHNAVGNLALPLVFANSLLQGDVENAFGAFWRFTINSTVGLAGVLDVAKDGGLQARKEDFGQTLGAHGIGSGPYLVLPLLGPSNGRDLVGKVADSLMDPFSYAGHWEFQVARKGVEVVDGRVQVLDILDEIEETSLDPYATIRSGYHQYRESMIRNGNPVSAPVSR